MVSAGKTPSWTFRSSAGACLLLCVLAGCGTGHDGPQLSSPGIGNKTLTAVALVSAENFIWDGSPDPEKYVTRFQVDLTKAGEPVTGATVKFSGTFGTVLLSPAESSGTGGSGRYVAARGGYDLVYTLSVQSGSDYIKDAFCTGPDIHAVTYPTVGTTYSPGNSLTVTWTRTTTADDVVVQVPELTFDSSKTGEPAHDTGTYTIPPKYISLAPFTTFTATASVIRGNKLLLTDSAAGDSSLSVEVVNSVKFSVSPQ